MMEAIKVNKLKKAQDNDCCDATGEKVLHEMKNLDNDGHNHDHIGDEKGGWKSHWQLLLSLAILMIMLVLQFGFDYVPIFPFNLVIFLLAYLLAGYNVLYMAFRKAKRFDFFNEFFLMSVATVGAFAIGSYSEGVAVMVFYSIGEWFQESAVNKAKRSIKAL
ncbi:MAG: hypothetical protein ABI419_01255, partial [Ginsengibacter sp.]